MEPTALTELIRVLARRVSSALTEERKRLVAQLKVAQPTADVWSEAQAAVPLRDLVQRAAVAVAGGLKEFVPASLAEESAAPELRARDLQSVHLLLAVLGSEHWARVAAGCPPAGLKPMAAATERTISAEPPASALAVLQRWLVRLLLFLWLPPWLPLVPSLALQRVPLALHHAALRQARSRARRAQGRRFVRARRSRR